MGRKMNDVMTITVPGLTRSEALVMKREIMGMKDRVAPHSTAVIAIGKKENFGKIARKCGRGISAV